MKRRNPNRGVVLTLHDAAAIHRWLEYLMDGRRFDNPIVAVEARRAAESAKARLEVKLMTIFTAHKLRSTDGDDLTGADYAEIQEFGNR